MELDLHYRKIMELLGELHEIKHTFLNFIEALKPAEKEEWLHIDDVMEIFKVSQTTVYSWIKTKQIPYRRLGGTTFFLKSELFKL